MIDQVRFSLEAKPVPAARPRVARFGVYYPKSHEEYKTWLMKELRKLPSFPVEGLVEVRTLFVMPPYKGSDYPTHRTDLDNLNKLPMDCMTKSVDDAGQQRYWQDDSLVVSLLTFKRFARDGEAPHTKVIIREIPMESGLYADLMFEHGMAVLQ